MSAALQFSAGKLMAAYGALTAAAVLPGSFLSKIYKKRLIFCSVRLTYIFVVNFVINKLRSLTKNVDTRN